LVICPQGQVEVPIGPEATGYGWFPLSMGGPPNVPAVLAAREELRTFLNLASARYPINQRKLVVLGFSQGGVMAYSLALGEPQRFSALVAISSWLSPELAAAASAAATDQYPPALIQHGSRDQLIPVERARESVESIRSLGIPVTYREYDISHEISPRSLSDLSAWIHEKVLSPIILAG
jgi:phospholipase/carboxylesterase